MTYPMSVGRNFDEILRAITALQTSDSKHLSMPADWQPGKDAIIPPPISNAAAKSLYPQGWNELRPYLRLTKTQ
jgi:peroxiredoxin (alkyl hydroperoxide reductase subunit C)